MTILTYEFGYRPYGLDVCSTRTPLSGGLGFEDGSF